MPQPLHIFRAGRHRPMLGGAIDFSDSDLADCAAVYDPALHEAPIVVGHPRHDGPAYGWVRALSANADGLHADPDQVDPAFAELVDKGRYKKISASFYHPDAPNNPKPGHWYLRHVGFLGAQPPAVKGLRPTEFADGEEGVVEFGDMELSALGGLMRRLRDWFISNQGQAVADDVLPNWQVDQLQSAAAVGVVQEQGNALQAENQRLADELAALRARDAERAQREAEAAQQAATEARDRRHVAHTAFAERLIESARLAPKHAPLIVALLDFSEQPDESGLAPCFGEGDARQNLAEGLCEFLEHREPVVSLGELATGQRVAPPASTNPLSDDAARRAATS